MQVLVAGSAGFIRGHVVSELLGRGHRALGLDNLSKHTTLAEMLDESMVWVGKARI
jgi:UDP-glucose 4-epimerase